MFSQDTQSEKKEIKKSIQEDGTTTNEEVASGIWTVSI